MDIPYTQLDPATLENVIEEFVSREGTDYGHQEYSLQQKVEAVKVQLRRGKVKIVYDETSQSCHIQVAE